MSRQDKVLAEFLALPSPGMLRGKDWEAFVASLPEWMQANIAGVELMPPVRVTKRCLVVGCPWPPHGHALCKGHYLAARAKYDPAFQERQRKRSLRRAHQRWASGSQDEPWRSGDIDAEQPDDG